MFIRKLEPGECQEHGRKCRTARLMECDNCHNEFVIHGEQNGMMRSYCKRSCGQRGGEKNMAHAEEVRKKWARIKYGRAVKS
jgi:hypothetical protein